MASVTEDVTSALTENSSGVVSASTIALAASVLATSASFTNGSHSDAISVTTATGGMVEVVLPSPIHFERLQQPEFEPDSYIPPEFKDIMDYAMSAGAAFGTVYTLPPIVVHSTIDTSSATAFNPSFKAAVYSTAYGSDSSVIGEGPPSLDDSGVFGDEVSPDGNIAPWQDIFGHLHTKSTVYTFSFEDIQDVLHASTLIMGPGVESCFDFVHIAETYFIGNVNLCTNGLLVTTTVTPDSLVLVQAHALYSEAVDSAASVDVLAPVQVFEQFSHSAAGGVSSHDVATVGVAPHLRVGATVTTSITGVDLYQPSTRQLVDAISALLSTSDTSEYGHGFVTLISSAALQNALVASASTDVDLLDPASATSTAYNYATTVVNEALLLGSLSSVQLREEVAASLQVSDGVLKASAFDVRDTLVGAGAAVTVILADIEDTAYTTGKHKFGVAV